MELVRRRALWSALIWLAVFSNGKLTAETIPPKPDRYFNDYAHVVSSSTADQLNNQLAQFERDTSNQVLVAIYPKMESDSDIADYTRRVAQSWGVGQKKANNGVVLFVFPEDHKMFIQTGYGAEGAIPDATAFDITERHIKPRFRNNDFDGGLTEGVSLMCKALQGEYKGTGRTVREGQTRQNRGNSLPPIITIIFFGLFLIRFIWAVRRGYRYSGIGGPYVSGGWGGSGGGWGSGGSSGGFSGGGGGFGGGGAGSSW